MAFNYNNTIHLDQYKGNFYVIDEVLIANLPPTKAPVTRIRFQIVPFSYRCIFKSIHFGLSIQTFAFSLSSSSFPCEQEVKTQRYRNGA